MKFTCEDGSEWEPDMTCAPQKDSVVLRRIQPAKKSLYEEVVDKVKNHTHDSPLTPYGINEIVLHNLCQHIEALERKMEAIERLHLPEGGHSMRTNRIGDLILEDLKK